MRVSLVILGLMVAFMAPNFFRDNWQAQAEEVVDENPRLVAAMFRSSWCSACRIIEPRIDDVKDDYENRAVEFIRFDFTMGQRDGLRRIAEDEGIIDLYDRLAGRTGFMVLMDRETGTVIEMITMAYDREQIREALDRSLGLMASIEADEAA